MSMTTYDIAAATGSQGDFRVAVELLCQSRNNPSEWYWADLNDRYPGVRVDALSHLSSRLISMPTIGVTGELIPGRFTYSVSTIDLDDDDHQFGRPCDDDNPWLLFSTSVPGIRELKTWHSALVRIRVSERLTDPDTDTWHALGLYRIKGISRSGQKRKDPRNPQQMIYVARMEFVPCSYALKETSARDVRRGDTWLNNAPLTMLVKELVERGSKGDYTTASDLPASISPTGTSQREMSVIGNMPVLNANGDWNELRNFVPRYQTTNGTDRYFVGYDLNFNCPCVVRWATTTNTWTVKVIGSPTYVGWSGSFAVAYGGYLYVFCAANITGRGSGYTTNMRNLGHVVARMALSLSGNPSWTSLAPVWRMGVCATRAKSLATKWWYGRFTGYSENKYNVPVPFPGNISGPGFQQSSYAPGWASSLDESEESVPLWTDDITEEIAVDPTNNAGFDFVHNSGYAAGRTQTSGVPGGEWPIISYLHGALHESWRYMGERAKVYWMAHDGSNWRLYSYVLTTQSQAYQVVDFSDHSGEPDSFWANCVTAFDVYGATGVGRLWIATMPVDVVSTDHNPTGARLWYHSTFPNSGTLSSFTALHSNMADITWNAGRKWMPVIASIRVTNSGAVISGVGCNIAAAGGHCYGFWYYASSAMNGIFSANGKSMHMSTMPYELSSSSSAASSIYYALDQATGVVWDVRPAAMHINQTVPVPIANGDAVDAENTWASCNIVCSSDDPMLLGVSSGGPPADCMEQIKSDAAWGSDRPDLRGATPQGRVSLWQYSYSISDVVGLADFGDAKAWDALEMCRQWAGDYIMGFDVDATTDDKPRPQLYFKARSTATPSVKIIEAGLGVNPNDGTVITCERMDSKLDDSLVVNQITVPTYVGEVSTPEASVILCGGTERKSTGDVSATQSTPSAQRLVLRCLRDGAPKTADYDGPAHPLLFSWSRTLDSLSTALREAAESSATEIYVRGLYEDAGGVTRLGSAEVRIGDYCQVAGGALRPIASIDVDTGRITLDGSVGTGITAQIGTTVTISPRNAGRFSDSAAGVCELRSALNVPSAGEVESVTVDSSENLAPGMILFRDTAYVRIVTISGTLVAVEGGILSTGTGRSATWPTGAIISGAVYAEHSGRSYAIGGTGVSISIVPPSLNEKALKKAGETRSDYEWRVGDVIAIRCAGLAAKRDDNTVLHAEDAESVKTYGPKEWKSPVENRLMTPVRARMLIEDLPELAKAPYITTANGCPFMPGIAIGDVFYCQHSHLWPVENEDLGIDSNNCVAHSVTGISHNLAGRRTTLTLRSYIVGGRAKVAASDFETIPAQAVPAGRRRRV